MKKALLLLTGGRGIPDMLMVKYLRPDVIINITTKQGMASARHLKKMALEDFNCTIEIYDAISPFHEEEIKQACTKAIDSEPDAEWIMSITSAPKILSIFAMDVARERNIPCWFLNTDESDVISLARDYPVNIAKLFHSTVEQYMKSYERSYKIPKDPDYRAKVEEWYEAAKTLAHAPMETHQFITALRQAQNNKGLQQSVQVNCNLQVAPLLHDLQKHNIVTDVHLTATMVTCTVKGGDTRVFLSGDWLEVYILKEVALCQFADDQQWGYQVYTGKAENELDVAFTYKAQLNIVECKTDTDPFKGKRDVYLDSLDSIAGALGGAFTNKFFITNHPNPEQLNSYQSFYEQAQRRRITILSGKDLPDICNTLHRLAKTPNFERI